MVNGPDMTPDSVLQYLRANPEFFEANAAAIAQINIPHPDHGRAISINERQLLSLRERCRQLEAQLADWVDNGHANDDRGERMHRLGLRVLAAAPADRIEALLEGLRAEFGIPWVYLSSGGAEHDALTEQADAATSPGCGTVSGRQAERLTELAGQPIASLAWVPVDTAHGQRVLMLGSGEPSRFPAEAGAQYLQRVGDMLKAILDGDG